MVKGLDVFCDYFRPYADHYILIGGAAQIFYNYWNTCINFEKSYFTRINYFWNNPVKHGYVTVIRKIGLGAAL